VPSLVGLEALRQQRTLANSNSDAADGCDEPNLLSLLDKWLFVGCAGHDLDDPSICYRTDRAGNGIERAEKIPFVFTLPIEIHPDLLITAGLL
jgi:hypothetical protein